MTIELDQTIAWMGLEWRVPADWEIVRHSLVEKKGALTFIDRRRQRLVVSWTDSDHEPDLETMVSNHKSREIELDAEARVSVVSELRPWHAVRRISSAGDVLTRAVLYHASAKRLIEVIVSTDTKERDGQRLLSDLLEQFRVVAPAGDARHWRAFGIDVTAPPEFRLVGAIVKPADVAFHFRRHGTGDRRTKGQPPPVALRRMGMARAWYAGNAEAIIRRDAPKVAFRSFDRSTHGGHPAVMAEGLEPAPPLLRWLGRQRRRSVLLWTCEAENALYELTTSSAPKHPVSPEQFDVHCCASGAHG
jgi:hypothetical protein